MLTAGIEAAVGKSILTGLRGPAAVAAEGTCAASATGTSGPAVQAAA